MGLQRIFKSSLIIQRENPRHHLVPAIFVGSSAAPRFMFALWHCVSGSHVSKDADHRLPKGDWRAEAFKRTGLTKVIHSCISEAASSAAALSRVPVVLGDTNIKTQREIELAIEEARLAPGSTWIGTKDTLIWSQCAAVTKIRNSTFAFTFEPAHLGKFHWDSEDLKIRGPGTTLFDHGFGFLASRCTFFPL